MFFGAHLLLMSRDADADRLFLRDVLGFDGVDVGHGWLILRLPPAEIAVHPGEAPNEHEGHRMAATMLYLMCDDLSQTMKDLADKGVKCTQLEQERWGIRTTIVLPSGAEIGLYQPLHELAIER